MRVAAITARFAKVPRVVGYERELDALPSGRRQLRVSLDDDGIADAVLVSVVRRLFCNRTFRHALFNRIGRH